MYNKAAHDKVADVEFRYDMYKLKYVCKMERSMTSCCS